MQALLDVILPVFLVVGFGYIAVWRKVFSTAAVDGLMSYTQNFAIPCLLFMALIKIDLSQAYSFRLMASYYIGAASGFALGFLGARYLFQRSAEDSVAIGFVSLFSNSVMMGLAITERAYGLMRWWRTLRLFRYMRRFAISSGSQRWKSPKVTAPAWRRSP
jgi:predicted permease